MFSGVGHSSMDGLWDKGTLENKIKANQSDEEDGLYKNEVKLFINTLIQVHIKISFLNTLIVLTFFEK